MTPRRSPAMLRAATAITLLTATAVVAPALTATAAPATTSAAASPAAATTTPAGPVFSLVGRYANGGSEVSAVRGRTLYTIGAGATIDIVDISKPSSPTLKTTVDLSRFGPGITSVDASLALVAVAIPAADKTDPGTVVLMTPAGRVLRSIPVGANPDMLVFDQYGAELVVANEGEPNSYVPKDDPEGSVSIIKTPRALLGLSGAVRTVRFTDFNVGGSRHAELPAEVRIFGPGASVAEDLEPEYITLAPDGVRAFVTLQENNAIAEIDLNRARVVAIRALALKDHSLPGNGLDASDRDGGVNIANWPVFGVPMPDGIASFRTTRGTFLITANEGDARADWPGYSEELRIKVDAYVLDPTAFPADVAEALKEDEAIGRLNATTASGDTDGDGDVDRIEVFGTRSTSIWSTDGTLVWDSGDLFEQTVAAQYPEHFNASNDNNDLDDRSDNKGPEPEGVTVGRIGSRTYAFVGLERVGGFMVLDVTDPRSPVFVQYANSRDFAADPESSATDSGPEVLHFVDAASSPTKKPLVVVSNEVSHTITIWSVG